MKQLLSSILILALLFIATCSALNDNVQAKSGGCMPPMNFAKEHNCTLEYSIGNEVAAYDCGNWKVIGDCEGGVIRSNENVASNSVIYLTIILVIIFVILLIWLIVILTKKPKEDEIEDNGYY